MKLDVRVEGRIQHDVTVDPAVLRELAAQRQILKHIHNGVNMANQLVQDVSAKVDALAQVVSPALSLMGQVVTELGELKAAVANAIDAGDTAALSSVKDRLDTMMSNVKSTAQSLSDAAKAADITPETPIDDGSGTQQPPEVTPLTGPFADAPAFDAAVSAYTGPEKVTLDGNVVRDGTDPALAFVTQGDNTIVQAPV